MNEWQRMHDDIAARVSADLFVRDTPSGPTPADIAAWVLMRYSPSIVWDETPPNDHAHEPRERFTWRIRCRAFMAGSWHESVGWETSEQRVCAPQEYRQRHRDHLRANLGRRLAALWDGAER